MTYFGKKLSPWTPQTDEQLLALWADGNSAAEVARHMGMGDKNLVDGAAVDAMRHMLGSVAMDGIVVIGEGEKDEAPMLFNGERIGTGQGGGLRHPDQFHGKVALQRLPWAL